MKRDMELVREILLAAENLPASGISSDLAIAGDAKVVSKHIAQLIENGYLEGTVLSSFGGVTAYVVRGLTWRGHDFIDSIRSESTWAETKSTILTKGGAMTFEIIKAVATSIAKQHLGLL